MISLTPDDTWLLKDVKLFVEPVEVYDEAGKLLGLFIPANLERGKELFARAIARIDRAEIERRKQVGGKGATNDELWGRIRRLEAEIERRRVAGEREWTTDEALAYFQTLHTPGTDKANGVVETGQCATR
jgi:hypothetical protein